MVTATYRVRKRSIRDSRNIFARLSASNAELLRSEALAARQRHHLNGGWIVQEGPVDFLPLQVKWDNEEIYVSFNGGLIENKDVVELPEILLGDGAVPEVQVQALGAIKDAAKVNLDPLSSSDWETIQEYAEELEASALLGQISIVYPGQTFVLQVANELAYVRVTSISDTDDSSLWPDEKDELSGIHLFPCRRIMEDTEVVFRPKQPKRMGPNKPLKVAPCLNDFNETVQELGNSFGTMVELKPFTVAVRPSVLRTIPGWSSASSEHVSLLERIIDDMPPRRLVATIVASDLVEDDCIVLHPLLRHRLGAVCFKSTLSVRILNHVEVGQMTATFESLSEKSELVVIPVLFRCDKVPDWRCPYGPGSSPFSSQPRLAEATLDSDTSLFQIGSFVAMRTSLNANRIFKVCFAEDSINATLPAVVRFGDLRGHLEDLIHRFSETGFPSPEEVDSDCAFAMTVSPQDSFTRSCYNEIAEMALRKMGAVLYAPRGSGRTHTALYVATHACLTGGFKTVYLDCAKLRSAMNVTMKDVLNELAVAFGSSNDGFPLCLVLDSLEELFPLIPSSGSETKNESARSEQMNPSTLEQSRLLSDTFCHLARVSRSQGTVLIVGTCESPDLISASVLSEILSGGEPFIVPRLSNFERATIFLACLQKNKSDPSIDLQSLPFEFLKDTEGYRPLDVVKLCQRVLDQLRQNYRVGQCDGRIVSDALLEQLKLFVPLNRSGASVEDTATSPSWSNVGGLFGAKERLNSAIIRPSLYRRIYERSLVRLPQGLLLFGEPGNGKTFVVNALAKKCGFRLVTCRGAELLDKYIGASESNVRQLFARATSVAPSILFLDELDALAPRRGSDNTGVTDRIVNQLLTFLDGVEDVTSSEQVFVIGASSRPDKIDPALLRPGRLEKHIYLSCSESTEEMVDLLCTIASDFKLTEGALELVGSLDFVETVMTTDGTKSRLTAADLKAAFSAAQLLAVHDALDNRFVPDLPSSAILIKPEHLVASFNRASPALSEEEYRRFQQVYAPFLGRKSSMEIDSNALISDPRLKIALR